MVVRSLWSFLRRKTLLASLPLAVGAVTLGLAPAAFASPTASATLADFEGQEPPADFFIFNGVSSVEATLLTVSDADVLARPDQSGNNDLLEVSFDVSDFGGLGQSYDLIGAQNWSPFKGVEFWFYGDGSGLSYLVELSENRSNPNADTSERWNAPLIDDTAGWRYITIPFSDFTRSTDFQPDGAPDDGLTLEEIWAWALVLPTGTSTVYFDDIALTLPIIDDFENALPSGSDGNGVPLGFYAFNGAGSSVAISDSNAPPSPVPGEISPNSVMQIDLDSTSFAGFIHAFENGAVDTWLSQDWSSSAGIQFWFYGEASGAELFLDVLDNRSTGSTSDDAERYSVAFIDDTAGWHLRQFPFASMSRKEIGNGAPNDGLTLTQMWGWAFGALGTGGPVTYYIDDLALYGVGELPPLSVTFSVNNTYIEEGITGEVAVKLNRPMSDDDPAEVSVNYASELAASLATVDREYLPFSGTLVFTQDGPTEQSFPVTTFDDSKFEGDERIVIRLTDPVGAELGFISQGSVFIEDNDPYDADIVDDFERGAYLWRANGLEVSTQELASDDAMARPGQDDYESVLMSDGAAGAFWRDFALGEDWSDTEALSFWFFGTGSGEEVTFTLKENRAADPGPAGWNLVWSDEFDDAAGTPPNPNYWNYEIGDVTPDGKNGWGNEELQYYTDDPSNAQTDGEGNLAITLDAANGDLECYYGQCEYTSARLTSWNKAEFAYGRIEARIKVPAGTGIWPAFWSLGTDIDRNPWPGTGEIDFMEFVGRLPDEIFGTIHGPGYAGGASYGDIYTFDEPVPNAYHTYTVEWQPDYIVWYVDGIQYHTATPEDVAPNEWVFNDPVFFLLNVAIGGNFGGTIGEDLTTPGTMLVDYVRVYQGPDSAERWEATFTDSVAGWQQITVPFSDLERAIDQPEGAPDDGLDLAEVWGYGFEVDSGPIKLDLVSRVSAPAPEVITLETTRESAVREALQSVADNGTVYFGASLAGSTVALNSPLPITRNVTIDASEAPGLTIDGGSSDRLLIVDTDVEATIIGLTLTNGYGFQLGGAIVNAGDLTLDRVTVSNNVMTTDAGDFWQGGGGIYNSDGARLHLIDSTVADNESGHTGGGIYSFFNTETIIERSTLSGNIAADVAGGLRILGNLVVENSTLSGNTSMAWHGGALFLTDGSAVFNHSTVTNNSAPEETTGGLFVGTFGESSASLTLQNSIVANNSDVECFLAPFGDGAVSLTSLGNNVFDDGSCSPIDTDQIVTDAGLSALSDNGGPSLTHALLNGSVAIDAANPVNCLPLDQRGLARDARCDSGSFEFAGGPSMPDPSGIEVTGNLIRWPDDGWYQVQSNDGSTTYCNGGRNCEVPTGTYLVINHTTGERFNGIVVGGGSPVEPSAIEVSGNTISWPDDGWYQVQSNDGAITYCNGGRSCEVSAGIYLVINHTTGERFNDIQVDDSPVVSGIVVTGNTISWPDDGWYQVQSNDGSTTYCNGGRSCDVPAGIYLVINHSTGERFNDIEVIGSSNQAGIVVTGNTISWPDDGWYQVQSNDGAITYCNGGRSCELSAGIYLVINHTTGVRTNGIEVTGDN